MKNALIRFALRAKRPSPERPPNRILAIATTALGDTLWATPALESLKKSFPDCYLAVLTSPIGMQILKHNPYVDRLHLLQEPLLPRFFSLRKTLLAEKFDTALIFHASQRLALPLAASIGASRIVGTAGINKGLDSLLTHPLPALRQHEIARRLQMVEEIGGKIHSQTLSLHLQPVERLPPREGQWVAIHPGSKDSFKRWPEEHFAEVAKALQKKFRCRILITGTRNEEPLMQKTAALIPGAEVASPNLPFRSFAALLEQMDLLLSNDTGPFHVACALKTPVIGIYSATDPFLCGPYRAEGAIAVSKKAACTPCLKRKCRQPFCLLQIGPEEVFDSASRFLSLAKLSALS